MKGIAFSIIVPIMMLSVGCSEYHEMPQEHGIDLSLQDSSYIVHDGVFNYLCGSVGVYRCPHRTHKNPDVLDPGLPSQAVKIVPDTVLKTTSDIYYFPSGSSYIKPGYSWSMSRPVEFVGIEASTDTKGGYYYNSILAEKRLNAAIKLVESMGYVNKIKKLTHIKCCFGRRGVAPPFWRDRYVMIKFKLKTEQGDRL